MAHRPFRSADHRPAGGPPISRDAFSGKKGIIAFDIHFSDANGHLDLWDGHTFYDEVYGLSHAATTSSTWRAACRCG